MNKILIFGMTVVISVAMLMTSCKKDKVNKDDDNNSNNNNIIANAVTDIDGNSYDAVKIGNQVWMAKNLRTTRYADSTSIPEGEMPSAGSPFRYAPHGNPSNVSVYGYLYNWRAVMHESNGSNSNPSHVQGVCPEGWHVPSNAEWTELLDYMKTQPAYVAGDNTEHLAKALTVNWGWNTSDEADAPGNNPSTNNATGFSALPAGCFHYFGDYPSFGYNATFWTATAHETYENTAYYRNINYGMANVQEDSGDTFLGFSVRCVKD